VLSFTKIKVLSIYLILVSAIFFASLNLEYNNLIDKKVNLGLDLQGGSYILLEIDTKPLINQKLQTKVIPIKKLLIENKINFKDFTISPDNISLTIDKEKQNKFKNLFFKQQENTVNNFISDSANLLLSSIQKTFSDLCIIEIDNTLVREIGRAHV
jgi:preprotein translocase subunit SecD